MPVLSGPGSGIPVARDENRDKACFHECFKALPSPWLGFFSFNVMFRPPLPSFTAHFQVSDILGRGGGGDGILLSKSRGINCHIYHLPKILFPKQLLSNFQARFPKFS